MSDKHDFYINLAKNANSVQHARAHEQAAHQAATAGEFEPYSLTSIDIESVARRENNKY